MTQSLPPKRLVLYADDDPEDIELLTEAFQVYAGNVELISFKDGTELIRYLESLQPLEPAPCLFIIDINMPRLDGKETLRKLRRMDGFHEIPAVLLSTSTLPSDGEFASKFNAGFVSKPLIFEHVSSVVEQIIEHCPEDVQKMIRRK